MKTTPPTHRLRVDGRLKRIKKYAFSNENAYVWAGPYIGMWLSVLLIASSSQFRVCGHETIAARMNYNRVRSKKLQKGHTKELPVVLVH